MNTSRYAAYCWVRDVLQGSSITAEHRSTLGDLAEELLLCRHGESANPARRAVAVLLTVLVERDEVSEAEADELFEAVVAAGPVEDQVGHARTAA